MLHKLVKALHSMVQPLINADNTFIVAVPQGGFSAEFLFDFGSVVRVRKLNVDQRPSDRIDREVIHDCVI